MKASAAALFFAVDVSLYNTCSAREGSSDTPLNLAANPLITASALVNPATRFLCPMCLSAKDSAALVICLIESLIDFLRHVVLAPSGWLFELWLALGGVLAAPLFASSVVTMPLLLDRRVSLLQAVIISWAVVLKNPIPMALWAGLIMGMTLLGLGSLLLGLVWIIPMLGHASWHAYRELIDASNLPPRTEN